MANNATKLKFIYFEIPESAEIAETKKSKQKGEKAVKDPNF